MMFKTPIVARPHAVSPVNVGRNGRVRLLRREMGFNDVAGQVDHFELRCTKRVFASVIQPETSYKVPDSWGDCTLVVFGDPKATLKLIEFPKPVVKNDAVRAP